MQELIKFLRQNRLRFKLIRHNKTIKLQVQNRHSKICKYVLSLGAIFFYLAILGEQKFSCTGISIFLDSFLFQTYLTKKHTTHTTTTNQMVMEH